MKNIFNGKRFMTLLKKEAYDLRSQYLKLMLIVTCTFLVIFLLFLFADNKETNIAYGRMRFVIGIMFLLGGTLLAPFQLYKRHNNKIFGVNYFMLPASQTEKWLSMFFYCVIATPVVLLLSITLIDLCLYPFYPWADKSLWLTFNNMDSNYDKTLFETLLNLFSVQSMFFLGNIWFKRAKVQKTILAMIILMIAYIAFVGILVKLSGITNIPPIQGISFELGEFSYILQIFKTINYLIAPVGLWIVSFMKMKEQQL